MSNKKISDRGGRHSHPGKQGGMFKIIVISFFIIILSGGYFLSAASVLAFDPLDTGMHFGNGVMTNVQSSAPTSAQTGKDIAQWAWKKALENWKEESRQLAGAAFKNALKYFLNKLAYDTATYLATGDNGQKPMFYTRGWGEYLKDTADNAAGTFLEDLGKGDKNFRFNLCQPDLRVSTQIGIGLTNVARPKKPKCTFSTMVKNWDQELSNPDFLPRFQNMFYPNQTELGSALTLYTGMERQITGEINKKTLSRRESPFKPVTDPISKLIKTPAELVRKSAVAAWEKSTLGDTIFTGTAADAIDVFISTLIGKLMQKWLREGLVTSKPDYGYHGNWGGFGNSEAGVSYGGITGAKARFKNIIQPQFGVRGDYNILSELTTCPDPTKAGPTNCVITDNFRRAISKRKTVAEAIAEGYLNGEGTFGFKADGLEPAYNEGYPYRSMIILRKFRILPVGWEVAAQYIKDNTTIIQGTKNLDDMVACYDPDDDYTGYYSGWCEGLVDPDWVLKAPLNYCRREGPGPEIQSSSIMGQGSDSQLNITRNDQYCADEQTCIKENNDGSCDAYGYCTEERRKWDFNGKPCDARYNTCQTFRGRDGATVSFLENTVNYDSCGPNNAGCLDYCQDYDYALGHYTCTINTGDKIYLNKNAKECAAHDEGCHEFLRVKAGTGGNLIKNSSFEETDASGNFTGDWPVGIGTAVSDAYQGVQALQLTLNLVMNTVAGPSSFSIIGHSYTLSLYSKGCTIGSTLNLGVNSIPLNNTSDWQRQTVTYTYPSTAAGNAVDWGITVSGSCTIDAVKLEEGKTATAYGDYRTTGLTYLKLAPASLGCNGSSDPPECDNFVRKCGSDEVGCELYTSVSDGMTVPAKVSPWDYCPAECAGYDDYLQQPTWYDAERSEYFIPKTAQRCSADAVGCDEFTNLDKLAQGGEAREYYSYLRRCNKPSVSSNCTEFYTWEGSDETGYQLKVHPLAENGSGAPNMLPGYNTAWCTEAIYNLSLGEAGYDPDCREFYSRSGNVYYRLYSWTITCSDDCHPYRRTLQNYDASVPMGACSGPDMHWDTTKGECIVCKNGGLWNSEHGACIYEAVPGESTTCNAAKAGCREYTGTHGSNMNIILNNDFEGSLQGWVGIGGTTVGLSSVAQRVGGNSLVASSSPFNAGFVLGSRAHKDNDYVLKFVARARSGTVNLNARLANSVDSMPFAVGAALDTEWGIYELSLTGLDHDVADDETLVLDGDGEFYIDEIQLTEITDRYYLIRDSWQTPESCDQDIYGNPWVGYMLGCDGYRDRANKINYLHNFTSLCQESAVGCEVMIDTDNYSGYGAKAWNDVNSDNICDAADGPDCEAVNADTFAYVVYDKDKECNATDKGCERLGKPYKYGSSVAHRDVYLKNNPDNYDSILCDAPSVDCEQWTADEYVNGSARQTVSYFKNPGDQVCEWRQGFKKATSSWGWFKKKVKKCDGSGDGIIQPMETQVCLDASDCATGINCILDENDYSCAPDYHKTAGLGGPGNRVSQPAVDTSGFYWAGLCPAAQAGCTEYIDPLSRFSANIVFNADFSQDVDGNGPDGWGGNTQNVRLAPFTLYRLAGENVGNLTITCTNNLYALDASNNISPLGSNTYTLTTVAGDIRSRLIYSEDNTTGCFITVGSTAGSVELKPAIVDYQLRRAVDKNTCNGIVNFENGCALFNERRPAGAPGSGLVWDADLTIDDAQGVSARGNTLAAEDDSNTLLKVTPDRACAKWLACRSYAKDENNNNVCYDIGLCDAIDANGNCSDFLLLDKTDQSYNYSPPAVLSLADISNMSGYSKVGYASSSLKADYYPLGAMDETGEVAGVPNGSFEIYGSNGYPLGWTPRNKSWNENLFSVIDNPVAAQTEGIKYPDEGRSVLKYAPSGVIVESETIDVEPGKKYVLSADVNTINYHASKGLDHVDVRVGIGTYDANGNRVHLAAYGDSSEDITSCSDTSAPWYNGRTSRPWYNGCSMSWTEARDWQNKNITFTVGPDTTKIKVLIVGMAYFSSQQCCEKVAPFDGTCAQDDDRPYWPSAQCNVAGDIHFLSTGWGCASGGGDFATPMNQNSCSGNVYIDNIKLMPALNNRDNENVSQTCRLYPSDDALACDYYDDSGKYYKGWPGYCLEYDRYPGSTGACVLWYPVDRVKGDGIEEGAGYQDRTPLYYCIEANMSTKPLNTSCSHDLAPNETTQISFLSRPYMVFDPSNDVIQVREGGRNGSQYSLALQDASTGNWVGPIGNDSSGPYRSWDLSAISAFRNIRMFTGVRLTCVTGDGKDGDCDCHNSGGQVTAGTGIFAVPYCHKLAQVVSLTGQNKYWSARAYQGSDFELACNLGSTYFPQICNYLSDYPLFGSIVPPGNSWSIISNPYEWDSKPAVGVQPLYYELPETRLNEPYQPRSGQIFNNMDGVQNLFAQSYGEWVWNDKSCTGGPAAGNSCFNNTDCEFTCEKRCYYGSYIGGFCATNNDCAEGEPRGGVCVSNHCSGGCLAGNACTSDDNCRGGICLLGSCSGGVSAGSACITNNDCELPNCYVCDNAHQWCGNACSGPGCISCANSSDCAGTCTGSTGGNYIPVNEGWSPPDAPLLCVGGLRPPYDKFNPMNDYCAILPEIYNVMANHATGNIILPSNQTVNLTFNTLIDAQQLPMTMYAVDWGDNENLIVSGVEMRDRPNDDDPHSLYHLYSYWDMKAKNAVDQTTIGGINSVYCGNSGAVPVNNASVAAAGATCPADSACCAIKPMVKVRDNWDWCNGGTARYDCNHWEAYSGWIIVTEK